MRLPTLSLLALALGARTLAAPAPGPAPTPQHHQHQYQGIIPIHSVGCKAATVDPGGQETAKNDFARWSAEGGRVVPNHVEVFSSRGAVWYVCNCKDMWFDPVPIEELNEVEDVLATKCGENMSGWVWSKKWQKGYNLVTADYLANVPYVKQLCPKHCLSLL